MNNKPDYSLATNTAYQLLINSDSISSQINLFQIAAYYQDIILITYDEMANRFQMSLNELSFTLPSEYGLTIRKGKQAYILYNNKKDVCTKRFTIAHELGHLHYQVNMA